MFPILLLQLMLFFTLISYGFPTENTSGGLANIVYVSKVRGQAKSGICGSKDSPCKTLQLGFERLAWGGQLYVDGEQTESDPYTCESGESSSKQFKIQKSFSLWSYTNSTARISCPNGIIISSRASRQRAGMHVNITDALFVESKKIHVQGEINVTLTSVSFNNTVLHLKDASAVIRDCKFVESSPMAILIYISTKLPSYFLTVKNTVFEKNCGCIEVYQPQEGRGCTQVIMDLQDVLLQENTILMKKKPKDKESGLISVRGSKNCMCEDISFSSNWKNVTAINNQGIVEYCNKSQQERKPRKCCWRGKPDPNSFIKSLFVAHACRVNLTFSEVVSKNNTNMRFLASKSRFNYVRVDNSSYHGHHIDNPGGVMHIKGQKVKALKGAFVNVTIADSDFFNNAGTSGGILQVDGGADKEVRLNLFNVSFLYSYGSDYGCLVSIGNVSNNGDAFFARVAKIFANFDGLVVNQTRFLYGKRRNENRLYAAFCLPANEVSQVSMKNSLFYGNKIPALLVKHKPANSSNTSNVDVKLENTLFTENDCHPQNATVTIVADSPRFAPVKKSSLKILNSVFSHNRGIAVIAKRIMKIIAINLTCNHSSGICLSLNSTWAKSSDVNWTLLIQGSVFTNNMNSPLEFRHSKPQFLDIQIRNSLFHNNRYRAALNIYVGLKQANNSLISGKLVVDRCNFTSNSVNFATTHVLNCILMTSYKANFSVLISKSVFKNNFQNSTGNTPGVSSVFFFYVPGDDLKTKWRKVNEKRKPCEHFPRFRYKRKMSFQDVIFENNTGSSSMLYINNGQISFNRCLFKDSYSHYPNSGAHVFIEEGTAGVEFKDTQFEQSMSSTRQPGNDTPCKDSSVLPFVYAGAKGPLVVRNSSFTLDAFERMTTMFIIQNGRYVHFDDETNLRCPVGSFIKLENSSHVIQPMFTQDHCRLNITRLQFVCRMCPVSTYSLQRGSFRSTFNKTHIDCLDCPFGALCTWNIKSRHNFWGYVTLVDPPRVRFKSCPENYCQEPTIKTNNSVFNKCSGNRTGTMCGACKEGFTESMFNHKCRPSNECRDSWFWVIAGLYSLIMAMYVQCKPPIVVFLIKKSFWFKNKKGAIPNSRVEQMNSTLGHERHGYSTIIFYFYQVAHLLMLESSSEILKKQAFLFTVISFYNFQVEMADSSCGCPFPGLNAVTKELFRSLHVFGVMSFLVLFYVFHWLLWAIRNKPRPHFAPYIASIVEVLLLGYERLGHTSLNLLACTPLYIHGRVIWKMFIDGNITCWVHWWQYALIAYNIIFVIPFLFVLFIGTSKLRRQEISAFHFVAACFVPLPFLMYWMLRRYLNHEKQAGDISQRIHHNREYRENLLEVLQGPFRPPNAKDQSRGALYWESILIGRRLVLLCLHSFVSTPMLQLLSMTFVCTLILLHDVIIKPFKDRKANILAVTLLFIHVVLGTINLSKASLINAGVYPKGPPKAQIHGLQLVEIALLCILPCAFFLLIAFCLISQAVRLSLMIGLYLFPNFCLKMGDRPSLLGDTRRHLGESYQPLL